MTSRVISVCVSLLLLVVPASAETTVDYIVKDGDTCLGIAIGVLGDRAQLATIHRLNPQLGKTPHVLSPGQILKLPDVKQKPDATLARTYNTVELRRAGVDAWSPAAVGAELFRAWRVGARERSNARVVFADRSAIEMRENTVVVIYGASSSAATSGPRRATLESGALRSRLAELDGRSLDIETTAGKVAMAAGSAIVEVAAGGKTLVSNHAGKPATLSNRSGATKIAAGFGADAERGKKPSPPRPLPPAPAWANVSTLATGWRTTGATVRATWTASAAAARYRIELATTSGDILAQIEVPASATALELHRIPAGSYRLAIGSVDATGLEGIPVASPAIEARLLAIAGEGEPPPIGIVDTAGVTARRSVALGSVLESSDVACTVDNGTMFSRTGSAIVACTQAGSRAELPVDVAPIDALSPATAWGPRRARGGRLRRRSRGAFRRRRARSPHAATHRAWHARAIARHQRRHRRARPCRDRDTCSGRTTSTGEAAHPGPATGVARARRRRGDRWPRRICARREPRGRRELAVRRRRRWCHLQGPHDSRARARAAVSARSRDADAARGRSDRRQW